MAPDYKENATRAFLRALVAQLWLLYRARRPYGLLAAFTSALLILELLAWTGLFRLQPGHPQPPDWPRLFGTFDLVALIGMGWGVAVWAGEPPSQREYHWSMPVSTIGHDTMRVVAGAVFLSAGIAWLCALGALLAWLTGGLEHIRAAPAQVWSAFLLQGLLPFFLVAAVATAVERPVGFLLGGVFLFLVTTLIGTTFLPPAMTPARLFIEPHGLFAATKGGFRAAFDPEYARRAPNVALLATVWFAVLVSLVPMASVVAARRFGRFDRN